MATGKGEGKCKKDGGEPLATSLPTALNNSRVALPVDRKTTRMQIALSCRGRGRPHEKREERDYQPGYFEIADNFDGLKDCFEVGWRTTRPRPRRVRVRATRSCLRLFLLNEISEKEGELILNPNGTLVQREGDSPQLASRSWTTMQSQEGGGEP